MPLDDLQIAVFAALRTRRNPDSHVAGAAAIHTDRSSPRYSEDIDFFHDAEEEVGANAEADAAVLEEKGFSVSWETRLPGFRRAIVTHGSATLKIEWSYDSAFRFFPVVEDPLLGWRLHIADLAVNKILAGVGRLVIRDFLDLLHLHDTLLHVGALSWAATGKDPGLSPLFILNELSRHSRYQPSDLFEVRLMKPVSLPELKLRWLQILSEARDLVERLPTNEVGSLYLDAGGQPVTPDPDAPEFAGLRPHYGQLKGSWPRVVE